MNAAPVKFSYRRLIAAGAVIAPTLALPTTPAHAVDRDWVGTGPLLFWDTATNWNPNGTPTDFDNLTLDLDLAGTPIILGASSLGGVINFDTFAYELTGAASGTLNTGGITRINEGATVTASNGLVWTHFGPEVSTDLYVGGGGFDADDTGDGTLNVTGISTINARSVYLGSALDTTGTATVGDGNNALLQTTGSDGNHGFFIGDAGTGTLNVLAGGIARIANDTSGSIADFELGIAETGHGTLNIDGAGALVVAEDLLTRAGTATINVLNGGFLNQSIFTSPDALLSISATGNTTALVSGLNSAWNMNRLEIGQVGSATVSVEDGGRITNESTNDIVIGGALGSSGKLAVVGTPESAPSAGDELISVLDANRDVLVGNVGQGEFRVGIGLDADLSGNPVGPGHADVDITSDLTLGFDSANVSNSTAYITGPNTDVTVGDILYVGLNADAEMTVNGGATVTSNRPRVASGAGTTASLTVDGPGSRFDSTLDMTVGTSGDATAVVSNGGVLTTEDYLAVGWNNNSVGMLTIDGTDSLVEVGLNNAGNLHLGGFSSASGGTGTLTIANGGRLKVSDEALIGGNTAGSGTLIVTGRGSTYDHDDGSLNDNLNVGFTGDGVMQVLDGAQAITERVIIGNGANIDTADLLVSGVNVQTGQPDDASQLTVAGYLWIGDTSKGTMTIADGALVRVGERYLDDVAGTRLIVGDEANSDGSSLTITGPGSRLDYFGTSDIAIGNAGGSTTDRALLDITDGAVLSAVQGVPGETGSTSARVIVGDIDNGNGQINVDGPGSRLEARVLYVGDGTNNSSGLVNLTDGGVIDLLDEMQVGSNGNGVGTVNVGGLDDQAQPFANASILNVGEDLELGSDIPANGTATGTLNVLANGQVNVTQNVFVGHFTGSFGTLTLGGLDGAQGILNVGNNLVVAGTETSSQTGSGSGTINLNVDGVLNIDNNLRVRDRGTIHLNGGSLRFNGLTLNTTDGDAATNPTFNWNAGLVRYDGAGITSLNDVNLDFLLGETGLGSPGVATLTAGQTLAVASDEPAGPAAARLDVPLRLNGGTLRVDAIDGNDASNLDFDSGTLELLRSNMTVGTTGLLGRTVALDGEQALHVGQAVTIQADGTLSITGDAASIETNANFSAGSLGNFGLAVFTSTAVDLDADDAGSGLVNNGRLVLIDADLTGPVVNLGSISIVGDSSISAAEFSNGSATTLEVSLDPSQVLAPVVDVEGIADLAGTLDLDHSETNFALPTGFTMTLLEAADLEGTFDRVTGSSLENNQALAVTYTETSVLLTRTINGDANLSGSVEQGDLDAVLNNWGSTGQTWATGDLNGNGTVEQGDLDAILNNWGSSIAPNFRGVAVPEPASILMLAGGLSALRRRR